MKAYILFAFFLLPICAFGQVLSVNNIPLAWQDFKPSNDVGGSHAAYVSIKLNYKILHEEGSDNAYYIKSNIYIDRTQTRVTKGFIEAANGMEKDKLLRHEKGHLILCAIQHAKFSSIVSSFHFTSSFQQELDSIFSKTLAELEASNITYDNETNHGLNASQETWEQRLMLQLEQVCKRERDIFNPVNTALYFKNPFFKLNDPINYGYEDAEVVLDYPSVNTIDKAVPFVVKNETPAADRVDSMLGVTGIDFRKNFEIELSFSNTKNAKEGIALFWAIEDSAESMGIFISRTRFKYVYCRGGDHKKDEQENFLFKGKMDDPQNSLAIRHIDDRYFIFMNGKFERELPYEPLPGMKLLIAPLKEGCTYQNFKIISLK